MSENLPKNNHKIGDDTLDETEVITRMMWVMHNFHIYDLKKIQWDVSIDKLFI